MLINWSVSADGERRFLSIEWSEVDGRAVKPPVRRGFGTRVVERTLVREHDAKVESQYPAAGFHCTIVVDVAT